jgi:proline dehydrogenase
MRPDQAVDADQAADALRRLALDEDLKQRTMADPALAAVAHRVARRYVGGETIDEAFDRVAGILARGHSVSVEYTGESVRDAALADAETDVFAAVAERIARTGVPSTLSLDLSHIGLVVDPELGYRNAVRLAELTARAGTEMMISAEKSDRADLVLATHRRLCADFDHVGITVQARLHRSVEDLKRVLELPGRIRLVKGSFLEPESVAYPRGSKELHRAYVGFAETLVDSGHPTSIATHDEGIIDVLRASRERTLTADHVEFEMLLGLGTNTLDRLHTNGFRTREYVIFGTQWWLYVLNRIAEEPERLYTALVDAVGESPG